MVNGCVKKWDETRKFLEQTLFESQEPFKDVWANVQAKCPKKRPPHVKVRLFAVSTFLMGQFSNLIQKNKQEA